MRNTYSSPEIEILYVSEDIITASFGGTTAPLGEHREDNPFELPDV